MKRIPFALSILAVCAVFVFIAAAAIFEISDPDTMLYLANGRYILEHGLPQECVFSYTLRACPIAYSEWLLHLIIYAVYLLGSWQSLVLFQAACVLGTFGIIFLMARVQKASLLSTAVILFLTSLIAMERFMLRADMVALIPLSLCFLFMSRMEKNAKLIFTLILLNQIIWANIHGSFPLGILIIFSFATPKLLPAFIHSFTGKKDISAHQKKTALFYGALLFLSLLASMINPYGIKALLWPLLNMFSTTSKDMIRHIGEYTRPLSPMDFQRSSLRAYRLLLAASWIIIAITLRRVRFAHLLLLGMSTLISLQAIRYLAVFAVFGALILPAYLDKTGRLLAQRLNNWLFLPLQNIAIITASGVLIFFTATYIVHIVDQSFYMKNRSSRRFGMGLSMIEYPVGAVDFIEKTHLPAQMFNAYKFGGYLHFRLYPRYKTFMHGSVLDLDMLEAMELFRYYRQISLGEIPHQDAAKKFGVNFFLIDHNNNLSYKLTRNLLNDPKWKLVYMDAISQVFLADTPETKEIIQKYHVNVFSDSVLASIAAIPAERPADRATLANELGNFFSKLKRYRTAETLYREAIKQSGEGSTEYNNLGLLYEKTGKIDQSISMLNKAIMLDPHVANTHLNLGRVYLRKKEHRFALIELEKAVRINPEIPDAYYLTGAVYQMQGNMHKAKGYFEKQLARDPSHELAKRALRQIR